MRIWPAHGSRVAVIVALATLLKSQTGPQACLADRAGVWDDLPMQGFERMDGELLDAAVGKLVSAGSMFAFLAAHRG